jgi:23S rRNA (cytidine1920-2'-O)/16S rRNA (cytidine1409-2'-O)-methyltransferase
MRMEKKPVAGKMRVDLALVERGLTPSRERARALILAGRVLVSEQKVDKPGTTIPEDAPIRLLGEEQRYVSRGGLKLEAALDHWQINLTGRACLDIGASTGGFTDCLLQHGAAHVTALDTGFGQIAMRLRNDPRVTLVERTNARLLEPCSLGTGALQPAEKPVGIPILNRVVKGHDFSRADKANGKKWASAPAELQSIDSSECQSLSAANSTPKENLELTLLVMDVSFISATLVLPPVLAAAPTLTEAIILVKPQFEAGRGHVGKGGIVRDPAAHQLAIDRVSACVQSLSWQVVETIPSPITGMEGNREFLLYARRTCASE